MKSGISLLGDQKWEKVAIDDDDEKMDDDDDDDETERRGSFSLDTWVLNFFDEVLIRRRFRGHAPRDTTKFWLLTYWLEIR